MYTCVQEQQLIMIYNLLDCVIMECYSKPLHLIPGVVVTPEYWFESFEIVESGFEGGDAEGAQHAMPPGARAQQEGPADAAVPPPLPPRPRRVRTTQVTRWSGLTAKAIVDDLVNLLPVPGPPLLPALQRANALSRLMLGMRALFLPYRGLQVELKVVHCVNTASALSLGSMRRADTEGTRNSWHKPGEFINKGAWAMRRVPASALGVSLAGGRKLSGAAATDMIRSVGAQSGDRWPNV